MATLYVTEYGSTGAQRTQIAQSPKVAQNNVAISGSTTQSAAFKPSTTIIEVHTDVVCSIEIGENPTATTASARMAADETRYYGVKDGDKIAVITNT